MNTSKYFFWNNILSESEIKNINSLLNKHKNKNEPQTLKAKNSKKTSTVYLIKIKHLKESLKNIFFRIVENNQNHYGYDVYDFTEDTQIHYNIYKKNNEYEWHMDAETFKSSDIKLTVLINISDSFFFRRGI